MKRILLSEDELARLAKLEKKATPGDWKYDPKRKIIKHDSGTVVCGFDKTGELCELLATDADIELLATMRNHLKQLLLEREAFPKSLAIHKGRVTAAENKAAAAADLAEALQSTCDDLTKELRSADKCIETLNARGTVNDT